MKHVYIHLLTWNGARYLPDLFESLDAQTYTKTTLRILDNGSTDGTIDYLRQHYPQSLIGRNVTNRGFAPGHNQLIEFTLSRLLNEDAYILYINQDMILEPSAIEQMVHALHADESIAAVQPKVFRAFGEVTIDDELTQSTHSDIIDTTGMQAKRGFRMVDRGSGELDKGQFDQKTTIIAPTGTIGMFRTEAVRTLLVNGEFYDSDYFTYREDVDLAWRFARYGLQAAFVPSAICYHHRGMYGANKRSLLRKFKDRWSRNPLLAGLSTRNQIYTVIKHIDFLNFILDFPWLVYDIILRSCYAIVFEPQARTLLWGAVSHLPHLLDKRRKIREKSRIKPKELRKWLV